MKVAMLDSANDTIARLKAEVADLQVGAGLRILTIWIFSTVAAPRPPCNCRDAL